MFDNYVVNENRITAEIKKKNMDRDIFVGL